MLSLQVLDFFINHFNDFSNNQTDFKLRAYTQARKYLHGRIFLEATFDDFALENASYDI